jgi:hypothetical protein
MANSAILKEINDYNKLILYYEKYRNKPWNDWLEFDKTLKPGKQGIVGLLNLNRKRSSRKELKCVFKISQYINYLIQHESVVMSGLNEISCFCPHFCKLIGTIDCKVDPKCPKEGNPFNSEVKYPVEKEVLLCELIEKSCKFYNYIRADERISEDVLYSTIKQVLLCIIIAQHKKQFTHYDLHSNNIMMRKCNKDLVFLYVIDEANQFAVPTLGHYPTIIDFGFSYIENLDDGPLWPSMGHTEAGFMSDRFDWVADPKLFLVTVSGEIKEKRKSNKSKKLRRIVRNIFHPLHIDWDSGWDNVEDKSASDYVTCMLEGYNEESRLFQEYDHYCIDILQSLIILPLEKNSYKDIHISYSSFMKEWVKIEHEIASPYYNLYILKCIVDIARDVRASYMDLETKNNAVKDFQKAVKGKIDEVAKFCMLKNIHYEKMLCSLYVLSRNIEGVLYDVIGTRMFEKEKEYVKLPLQSTEQIYGAIECNLPDDYVYNNKTSIFIINSSTSSCCLYKLPEEEIDNINDLHPMARGTFIYDLYKSS